jgi:hypothetical protein
VTTGATRCACAVQFLADRSELTLLELADRDPTPAVRGPDERGVHQLQHRPLAKGVRGDLRAAVLFEEEPLEQVGRANHAPMAEWEAQVRDARVEVAWKHCTTAGNSRS